MADEERSSKKKHGLIRILISLAFLVSLSFISVALISGRGFNFGWLTNFFQTDTYYEITDELFFNVGRGKVFADLETSIAAAGSLGVQVLSYDGSENFRVPMTMSSPAIASQNRHAIAFDIGGTDALVFNDSGVVASIIADGPIVSGSINQNGWFTVDAQPGGGYRGNTVVYDNRGRPVYRVHMSTGYILSSVLSPDNSILAILNLTEYGNRITFYHGLDRPYDDGSFELSSGLILDIHFLSNNDLLAITTDSLILIDPQGASGWEIYRFSDMRIGGYEIGSNYIVLYLLDFGIGHRGKIIIIDHFGNLFGEIITDREVISMSLSEEHLSVMLSDGLILLDKSLNPLPLSADNPSAAGVSQIIALRDKITLVAGERFAIIVR